MPFQLTVNARRHRVDAPADMALLWVLREILGVKGPKYGCGVGACGACTVHLDGQAIRACVTPVSAAAVRRITTIEGLAPRGGLHPVQQAWIDEDVAQCGYCQPGQIMAVAGLLKETPNPTDADIDERLTNLCRCGAYSRIRAAVHRAARLVREAGA